MTEIEACELQIVLCSERNVSSRIGDVYTGYCYQSSGATENLAETLGVHVR